MGFSAEAAASGAVVLADGGVTAERLGLAAVVVPDALVSMTGGEAASSDGGLAAGLGLVGEAMRPVGVAVGVLRAANAGLVASAGFAVSVGDSVASILAGSEGPVGRDGVVPVVCWRWMPVGIPPSGPGDVAVLRRGDELLDVILGAADGEAADETPVPVELVALEVDEPGPGEGSRPPEPGVAAATAPPRRTARPRPATAAASRNCAARHLLTMS